jgi:hypothetical protein
MTQRRGRFADLPPITDFESYQRVRPLLLHRCGDLVRVWSYCPNRTCRRSDGACFIAFMQAAPDTERRRFRYAIENRQAGLDSDEACRRADARVAAEIVQDGG